MMRNVTARENELLLGIVKRIDRKLSFEAFRREDGDIDVRLSAGRLHTTTQLSAAALAASAEDVIQFEALRGKVKRVCDRMRMPAPPLKAPKVVIQKEAYFGNRPTGRRRR